MKFITGIIFIVIAIAAFFGFTNPQYQDVKTLSAEAARYNDALDKAKQLTAQRDALAAQYNNFSHDQLTQLDTLLPDSIDTVRLIIDINNIAKADGLSLSNVSVAGPSNPTASGGKGANAGLGPQESSYGTVTFSFGVATTYDQFKRFLGDLEHSLRVMDITNISFGEAAAGTGVTTYSVQGQTYWLR